MGIVHKSVLLTLEQVNYKDTGKDDKEEEEEEEEDRVSISKYMSDYEPSSTSNSGECRDIYSHYIHVVTYCYFCIKMIFVFNPAILLI